MGNAIGKIGVCFVGNERRGGGVISTSETSLDEGLGHSFCYVRPDTFIGSSSKVHSSSVDETSMFRSISGASISANTSTPLSTSSVDLYNSNSFDRAAAFESSQSFASIPLQPVPRYNSLGTGCNGTDNNAKNNGPVPMVSVSGPLFLGTTERGFLSGPIERGFMSGPLDTTIERDFKRSYSHGFKSRSKNGSLGLGLGLSLGLIRVMKSAISKTISRGQTSIVAPIKGAMSVKVDTSSELDSAEDETNEIESRNMNMNLQWAQGKAGEDRVHVVISEELGWVFVGIYDGFNGPDAPHYLLSNLYNNVHEELKGLLWEEKCASNISLEKQEVSFEIDKAEKRSRSLKKSRSKKGLKGAAKKWEEGQRRWKTKWDRQRLAEVETQLKEHVNNDKSFGGGGGGDSFQTINHTNVLKALSQALRKTEESYLDVADRMVTENPELALMGSCVLVMLMKGEDVYVMNVGDSRAVLAQTAEPPELWLGNNARHDLEMINEETSNDLETDDDYSDGVPNLNALQLTLDHSTCVDEEVERIKNEHRDDPTAVVNDRVKGSLKVTRAFGAGFLKQVCINLLIKAVSEVELFIISSPDGDPAQHLVEEVLFRAAKKAGMEFHELLEIPQGDRRRYHDDVSIIVISLEGRIWRSCV
ncbi:hypothetical protein GIB67_040479 [Kingdonia uniflora]|uniref:PPM-type phosphatase domain-containing protein n=1 Tax=Kingdonia uniflora TaxID=39325 RepID=A0A7J7L550_9MAGN|nr:hypothetical protein GIB67_040479 [Kingdonia uniflora]